jgi:hypothetical protein
MTGQRPLSFLSYPCTRLWPHQQEVLLSSHLSEGRKRGEHFLIMICPIMPSPYLNTTLRRAPN